MDKYGALTKEDLTPLNLDGKDIALAADAAAAFQKANEAYKQDHGRPIQVNSGFRTYQEQAALYTKLKGKQAVAPPGKSNHNFGTALDIQDFNDAKPYLEAVGFKWANHKNDPFHFDFGSSKAASKNFPQPLSQNTAFRSQQPQLLPNPYTGGALSNPYADGLGLPPIPIPTIPKPEPYSLPIPKLLSSPSIPSLPDPSQRAQDILNTINTSIPSKPQAQPAGPNFFSDFGNHFANASAGYSQDNLVKGSGRGVGSFLGDTAGGLVPVGAGALAGAGIGSVVPVLGTGLGALGGGIAGAGIAGTAQDLQAQRLEGKQNPDFGRALGAGAIQGGLQSIPVLKGGSILSTIAKNALAQGAGGALGDVAQQALEQQTFNPNIDFNRVSASGALGAAGGIVGAGGDLYHQDMAQRQGYQDWLKAREPLNNLRPADTFENKVITVPKSYSPVINAATLGENPIRQGVVAPEQINHPGGTPAFYPDRKSAADAFNKISAENPGFVGDIKKIPSGDFVIHDRNAQPGAIENAPQPIQPETSNPIIPNPEPRIQQIDPGTLPSPKVGESPAFRATNNLENQRISLDGQPALSVEPKPSILDIPQPKPQDSNIIPQSPDPNLTPRATESLIAPDPQKISEVDPHEQSVITDNQVNKAFQDGKLVTTQDGAEIFTGKTPEKTQAALNDLNSSEAIPGAEGNKFKLVGLQEARDLVREYLPDKMKELEKFWQAGSQGEQLITNYRERIRGWAKGTVDEHLGKLANGKVPGTEEFKTREQALVSAAAHRRINPTHEVSDPYQVTKLVQRKGKEVQVTKWRVDAVGDRQIDPFGVGVIQKNGEPYLYLMSYNYGSTKKGNIRGYRLGRLNETLAGFDASKIGQDSSPYGNTIQAIQKKADQAREHILEYLPGKKGLEIIADVDGGNIPRAISKLKQSIKGLSYEDAQNLEKTLKAYCGL
jgi:hypothetical protein